MIKMKGKQKNNLNFSKELSLNIKISSNNNNTFLKTNNISLDFTSSPIKNNKKVIKRNTRTNSYNSFINNQTENFRTNKNPFNSGIISFDSKINLKKNIFTFSNAKQTILCNSKNNNNINQKKNKNKTKNITAHQSTSNLAKYNINLTTDNNSNDYININTNPNITSSFILNKKNQKNNNNSNNNNNNNNVHNHFHNFIKDNNFYSFSLQEKNEKEKDKVYFRNMNNTSKNLLFLTRPNYNLTKFQNKNKTSLCKNSKHKADDLIINKNYLDFNYRGINSNPKSQKNLKNSNTKTTKNSKEKNSDKLNRMSANINNNITNYLELSTEKQKNEFLNEYELLYNCLKKRNEVYKNYNKECRSKSGRKNNRRKKNILDEDFFTQDSLMDILHENKQIRLKNEELSQKFESIKIEFEQMKKDNNDIKEELKEKTKYLKDIKLTMDIFSQELLKLQTIYNYHDDNKEIKDIKDNNNNKIINSYKNNSNLNLKDISEEDNKENEKQKKIIEINSKNKSNNVTINNNNNNIKINNNIETETESISNNYIINTDINNCTCEIDKNNKNILQKNKKMEKIHQLSLNNINNLMNQQKKRGNSLEANNFQDTSKIINNETKDATEKENECLNDKWPSPLYLEKKEKEKEINNENNKEDGESIDLTNISLADNLNINEEMYKNALNIKKNNIIKLDFENKLINKNEENNRIKKIPKNLNLINQEVANDNFNEEFLKYYDKFSDSWRKEVDKMLKKGKE